ncbi:MULTISPECIES: GNAT family N-acetyltransferase [Bacillus]|uniref:N-acetyltransferase n=2 Tax=Bacillus toyonensis TaxID=155322 RepID=A0A2C4H5S2_9BACI|nr:MULTISPECIES: N-acetyltransferase [Bacillus]EEL21936.1 GCN5-related N-acetyltransferase [Bacillus cereus Rock1-3]EEL36708.1 GCN5-related N-acetyltransferase [Bacillus cereus Rock3-29]KAB0445736.1 N-acetyltransferase [Lysinibacillus sp. VIA-II-2016]KNH41562.1 GCN5 family acetyltransferase [Bacillus thuringiensis]KXY18847.1 GCN5 family acetyltransferase [Bacillus cereus]MDH8705903.1 putative N-acetyltransferase YhbS [Stenotrophomonas sp. 1198]
MVTIRQEQKNDYRKTEEVVKEAFLNEEFSDKKEHELVKRIRECDAFIPELSIVAVDKEIVGHIMLSKITIEQGGTTVDSLALAPVSIAPSHQKKGIGGKLITAALEKAKELGYGSVVVLGHPEYYPKFGFERASQWNIKAPFEVPDEVFMVMELRENTLQGVEGIVQYSSAFAE